MPRLQAEVGKFQPAQKGKNKHFFSKKFQSTKEFRGVSAEGHNFGGEGGVEAGLRGNVCFLNHLQQTFFLNHQYNRIRRAKALKN